MPLGQVFTTHNRDTEANRLALTLFSIYVTFDRGLSSALAGERSVFIGRRLTMFTHPPSPPRRDSLKPRSSTSRLILVSNRLPVTVNRSGDGQFQYQRSSGGLVTCMSGLRPGQAASWYGWPGSVEPRHNCRVRKDLMQDHHAVPVFLEQDLASKHYSGFSSMSEATFNVRDCH